MTKIFIFLLFIICGLPTTSGQNSSYVTEKIMLENPVNNIYGTYTFPRHSDSFSCVLIIAGSGPTDRNGNSMVLPGENNSLKMLAESLALFGIASLRYDKRGVGESRTPAFSETGIRFEHYVHDATQWIQKLKQQDSIHKVGIIGHSEGSLIGMIAANRSDADFFISLNGPGMPADSIIIHQMKNQPEVIRNQTSRILRSLKKGRLVDSVPGALTSLFRPTVQPYLISWLQYNPQIEIAKLNVPVLVIHGKSDLQVDIKNAQKLVTEAALAEKAYIDSMNHVLKITGDNPQVNFASYSNPNLPISKELIQSIVKFIKPIH